MYRPLVKSASMVFPDRRVMILIHNRKYDKVKIRRKGFESAILRGIFIKV